MNMAERGKSSTLGAVQENMVEPDVQPITFDGAGWHIEGSKYSVVRTKLQRNGSLQRFHGKERS